MQQHLVKPAWWATKASSGLGSGPEFLLGTVGEAGECASTAPNKASERASPARPNYESGSKGQNKDEEEEGQSAARGRGVPRACGVGRSWQRAIGRVEDLRSPDRRAVLEGGRVHGCVEWEPGFGPQRAGGGRRWWSATRPAGRREAGATVGQGIRNADAAGWSRPGLGCCCWPGRRRKEVKGRGAAD